MTDFPQPKFDVIEEDVGRDIRVLAASGEIHVSTAPELAERLSSALSAGRSRLVLDFTEVEFIDSTGLSVLLNALRTITHKGGALAVACTNPTVLRLFQITRLDATFDIVATRQEALANVAPAATD
jgi:anti-sigma B factor antagonist